MREWLWILAVLSLIWMSGLSFEAWQKGGDWTLLPLSIFFGLLGLWLCFWTIKAIKRTTYRAGLEEGELKGTGDLGLALQWRRNDPEEWKLPRKSKKSLRANTEEK